MTNDEVRNDAICLLSKLIEEDHYVPEGAMSTHKISDKLNHNYKEGFIRAYQAAHASQQARIDALEAKLAEVSKELMYWKVR